MMMSSHVTILWLTVLTVISVGVCDDENGFPCSIKGTMQLDRLTYGAPQRSKPPFVLKVFNDQHEQTHFYTPGKTYSIRMTGSVPFRTLLLEARESDSTGTLVGNRTAGRFVVTNEWSQYGIKPQSCGVSASELFASRVDAVTHTDSARKKFVLKLDWTTDETSGPIQFVATIGEGKDRYWEVWRPRTGLLLPRGRSVTRVPPLTLPPPTLAVPVPRPQPVPAILPPVDSAFLEVPPPKTGEDIAVRNVEEEFRLSIPTLDEVARALATAPPAAATRAPVRARVTAAATTPARVLVSTSTQSVFAPIPTLGVPSFDIFAPIPTLPPPTLPPAAFNIFAPVPTAASPVVVPESFIEGSGEEFDEVASRLIGDGEPNGKIDKEGISDAAIRSTGNLVDYGLDYELVDGEPQLTNVDRSRISLKTLGGVRDKNLAFSFGSLGNRLPPATTTTTTTAAPTTTLPPNPCLFEPCRNGGRCEPIDELIVLGEPAFECVCAVGFLGKTCELPDRCINVTTCQNGKCINVGESTECECFTGWAGKVCNRPCPEYYCEHDGICTIFDNGEYGCKCNSGWGGKRCDRDNDDCASSPCKNGGACTDHFGGYTCKCADGWMGENCDRPCQDLYGDMCKIWSFRGQCEALTDTVQQRASFFRSICGISCGVCTFDNSTIVDLNPLPEVLKPLRWMIGSWETDESYDHIYFPVDFPEDTYTYAEQVNITLADHLYLNQPALQISSFAVSKTNLGLIKEQHGYITLGNAPTGDDMITVTTTTSDGLTVIEEGQLSRGQLVVKLTPQYVGGPPELDASSVFSNIFYREFSLDNIWLRQRIVRREGNQALPTSKYYYRADGKKTVAQL